MFPSFASSSHSSSGGFGCPPLFGQETQKGDAFASSTSCSGTVFGSPIGMTNYGGTSSSSSSSSSTAFGCSSYSGFGSLNGPPAPKLTFNLGPSHLGSQGRGSGIAVYKTTAEATSSVEKLVSISAMPAYNDKSHEELRWEDYNFTGKGWFDSSSSAQPSRSPATNFATASWTTPSISSNTFDKAPPSVAAETTTWKYPGPSFSSCSHTYFTAPPPKSFNPFAARENLTTPASTTVSAAPLNLFSPFAPGTNLTSSASNASSISLAPLNKNPFINPFTSLATQTSTTVSAAPLNPFNSFSPGTNCTSATSTASSISLAPLNKNPFLNPFTSLATQTSTTVSAAPLNPFNPFSPGTNLTSSASNASSISLAPLNKNPFINPFTSLATQTSTTVSAAPLNPFNSFSPGTNCTSATFTASSISLAPLNKNPFLNPFTSLATQTSTTVSAAPLNLFNPFAPGTSLTSASSISLAPLNNNPFINPSTSLATQTSSLNPTLAFIGHTDSRPSPFNPFWPNSIDRPFTSPPATAADKSILVSPASSGLSSSFNQQTTLLYPSVPSAQNWNGSTTGIVGQSYVSQLSSSQITSTENASSVTSPFGTLPPNPRLSFDCSQSKQPIQYGISSIPVKEKPAPVNYSSLTTRHLSRSIKVPVRKYDPKSIATKKPFFCDTKEIPVAAYVPRENPRALVVCPENWPPRAMSENIHEEKFSDSTYEDDRYDTTKDEQLFTTILGVPSKLQQPDYYTQPEISELELKERADPGYCRRVKDFVVGRHGYGSIKFLGETDVTNVDIETNVQFNNREVIVYVDDSKKPPVGEGFNKAAEITLLNIKCIDKKTGMQYTDGSKINRYAEMLKKKAEAQGAEFISYDPVEGEWKFRVQHF